MKRAEADIYNPLALHQRHGNNSSSNRGQSLTRTNSQRPARVASAKPGRNNYHTNTVQELKPIKRQESSLLYTGLGITAITPSTNDTDKPSSFGEMANF
jgi:hypothetical protein